MNRYIIFIAMITGLLLAMSPKGTFGDVFVNEQNSDVSIIITKFQVNDQTLELGWKIVNSSDHDVWICDSITTSYDFDWFIDQDNETLKIIKRSSLPQGQGWEHWPWVSFIRLHPGQDKEDSISLTLPIRPSTLFSHQRGNAEFAKRLSLEIGFYDEDLRGLILNIVDLTEQLNCDMSLLNSIVDPEAQILKRFFAGVSIAQVFHKESFGGFRNSILSDGDEIAMPFMNQLLYGEKVLRATIKDVDIPYKSNHPPLTDEPPQSEAKPAEVTMALTGFDVNDANLELSWNIKNNTDHDVWVCESMSRDYPPPLFEQFLDEDAKTLVIRKRFDLPMREGGEEYPPIGSRYVRLHPGEEKVESYSVALPVRPYRMSASNKATNAEYAERLALEIGYYDEDLPALILEIVEISEHLNIDFSVGYHGFRKDVSNRFFGGPIVALLFKGMLDFEPSVRSADADGEMWLPHFDKVHMGEKVLRIEVDGVSIPYKSNYPPLND